MDIKEGDVVIVSSGQAGTFCCTGKEHVCVLLANGCLWYGHYHEMRKPQGEEDLAAAVLEVDRFKDR
jgi:hypothetical protein